MESQLIFTGGKALKSEKIYFEIVDSVAKRTLFKRVVNNHHKYKPKTNMVGRRIDWLIMQGQDVIGAVGIGSALLAIKPRDDFIGWDKAAREKNLRKVANNWRFCMIKRGLGSRVLSILLKEAKKEWEKKYGDELQLIETLVEPPFDGKVYASGSWFNVGKTKGANYVWMSQTEAKKKGLRPVKLWGQGVGGKYVGEDGLPMARVIDGYVEGKHIFLKPLTRSWKKKLQSLER